MHLKRKKSSNSCSRSSTCMRLARVVSCLLGVSVLGSVVCLWGLLVLHVGHGVGGLHVCRLLGVVRVVDYMVMGHCAWCVL